MIKSRFARTAVAAVAFMSFGVAISACGGSDSAKAPSDCTVITGGKTTMVAKDIKWNTKCLKLDAPGTVAFTVDNQDKKIAHDLQVSGQGIKEATKLEEGPITQKLDVKFPTDGYYQFVCTVHANMEGSLYVG